MAATWLCHRALLAPAAPLLVARLESAAGIRALPLIYVTQAALFAALAVAAPWGLAAILPLVALDGLLAPTARALARAALVAAARPLDLLRDANAPVNPVFTANGVLAPATGGVLVALVGAPAALTANAASFLLAALAVAGARLPRAAGRTDSAGAQLRAAVRHVRAQPVLARLVAGDAAVLLFLAAIAPIEVAFVTGTLDQSTAAFGLVLTIWAAGMIAGGAGRRAAAPICRRRSCSARRRSCSAPPASAPARRARSALCSRGRSSGGSATAPTAWRS